MLLCADGRYYVGHTDNLEQRIWQHKNGYFQGYTHKRRPVKLVWSHDFPTRDEAKEVERQIKGWSRDKKAALIASDWELISELAKSRKPKD